MFLAKYLHSLIVEDLILVINYSLMPPLTPRTCPLTKEASRFYFTANATVEPKLPTNQRLKMQKNRPFSPCFYTR